jgi:hypothetical protein
VGPRAGLDGRKIPPHRHSIPGRPARSSVAIPTEPPGPQASMYTVSNLPSITLQTFVSSRRLYQLATFYTKKVYVQVMTSLRTKFDNNVDNQLHVTVTVY